MRKTSKREYVDAIAPRYGRAPKKETGAILLAAMRVTGWHRKALIRMLHRTATRTVPPRKRGRRLAYGAEVAVTLKGVWGAAGKPRVHRGGPVPNLCNLRNLWTVLFPLALA